MLLLTREENEAIVATTESGQRIIFRVTRCQAGRTQFAVSAPKSVRIDREEIDQKRQKEASHDEGY